MASFGWFQSSLAVLVGLLVLGLLWMLFGGDRSGAKVPSWARYSVSRDTKAVFFFDLEKFRETRLFKTCPLLQDLGWKRSLVRFEEVQQAFFAIGDSGTVGIYRSQEDSSMDDFFRLADVDGKRCKYKGFEYLRALGQCAGQTDRRIFVATNSLNDIEDVLKRTQRQKPAALSKNLECALQSVAGADYGFACDLDATTESLENFSEKIKELARRESPNVSEPSSPWERTKPTAPSDRSAKAKRRWSKRLNQLAESLESLSRAKYAYGRLSLDSSAVCLKGAVVFAEKRDARQLIAFLSAGERDDVIAESTFRTVAGLFDVAGDDFFKGWKKIRNFAEECRETKAFSFKERGNEVQFEIHIKTSIMESLFED
ncbi:MAG: hypothetical protein ABFC77_02630 [Thermoguttaceae bacterium]